MYVHVSIAQCRAASCSLRFSAACCACACRAMDGHAERRAALDMSHRQSPGSTRQLTLGADKGFDAAEFVADLRQACVNPHVARKSRYSAIDARTTRHKGCALSIKHRKRIEEAFGWAKTVDGMAQTVYRSLERVRSRFILTMAANDLARPPRLLAAWRWQTASNRHAFCAKAPETKPRQFCRKETVLHSRLVQRSAIARLAA